MRIFKIHENDNVAVAIETIGAGECVEVSGGANLCEHGDPGRT